MSVLGTLHSAVSAIFHRRQIEDEMEEELRAHIEQRAGDLERSGVPRNEAERQARLEFGSYERYKEECRENVGTHFVETLRQDLAYAFRLLRKSPGFAGVAVLTLALGIGANTAIFGVIYSVLLRPLPYSHPKQLVVVLEDNLSRGVKLTGSSYPVLTELQNSGLFESVGGVSRHQLTLTGSGDPTVVTTVVVTPEIFSVLNVAPLAGRYLFPEDERKGAAPAVVLSEGLWRTRFGGNPSLVGTTIVLDQRAFTVVGIMPAGFHVPVFGNPQQVWIPLIQDPLFGPWMEKREQRLRLAVMGRLKPDVSRGQAQAEVDSITQSLANEFPKEEAGWAGHVIPAQRAIVDDVRIPLLVLLGAVGLVLLLACVNIANLLLARATTRTRELALRQALGAGRGRIIRQLLTESALLGLLGAILGLTLAYASRRMIVLLLPGDLGITPSLPIDGWVLGFALLLTLAATLAFGLAPALLTANTNLQSNLKDSGARAGSGGGMFRVRRLLAAAEIGLAAVLVVSAGLLARSLITMTAVNPGFRVAHILKAEVSLPQYRYSSPQQSSAFAREFLNRLQAKPGMNNSAFAVPTPLADTCVTLKFSMANHAPLPPGTPDTANFYSVSPAYFHVMGISLMRGRLFAGEDSESAPAVALISEAFAKQYFRDEDPIGKSLMFGFPPSGNVIREIVGVVGDVRDEQLSQEPGPVMYVPFAQSPFWGGDVVVNSSLPAAEVVGSIRDVVRSLDKDLPVTDVVTMREVIDNSVAQPKFRTWLLGGFGVMALLLAAVGVFGVVSYSVASRTREFGVRAALGASPGSIGKMILGEGLVLGGVGLGVGLAAALGLARFLQSELYGVAAYDPVTFAISAGALLGVAIVACYVPARRAMSVDPVVALRYE